MERLIALAWRTFWVVLGASAVLVAQSVMSLGPAADAAREAPPPAPAEERHVPFAPGSSPISPPAPNVASKAKRAPIVVPVISELRARTAQRPLG